MAYLFQRPGSSNWWLKLQAPTNLVKSLGTSDKRQADALAAPDIAAHKAALAARRPHLEWGLNWEPGEYKGEDGGKMIASEHELIYFDPDGKYLRSEPNRASRIVPPYHGEEPDEHGDKGPSAIAIVRFVNSREREPRPVLAAKGSDDDILETYLSEAKLNPRFEREARDTWEVYKRVTNNKPLAKATRRDEGKALAAYFLENGNKSATVAKKIGWIRSACALAIKDGLLKVNPFVGVISDHGDELRRKPLDDAMMAICKQRIGLLSESDQLLFRFLATTGARLGEAFQIDGEQSERGARFVVIGSKTEASLRRVPLPKDLLPYLPKVIKGALFKGNAKAASARLNNFLDEIGLKADAIVVHSLRHRAADKLRAAECPADVRYALLGHENRTIAESYGEGHSVPTLKKWLDKVGF
jgi:integrase